MLTTFIIKHSFLTLTISLDEINVCPTTLYKLLCFQSVDLQ